MKISMLVALLMATALSGCSSRPSTPNCFGYAQSDGPCSFTPVSSTPWETFDVEAQ